MHRNFQTPTGMLTYQDMGEGEVIVIVHGTPSSSEEFSQVATELARSYRVILPDHLGFGRSEKPFDGDYSLKSHTNRLEALLTHLNIDHFHLVVHDFGGAIALPIAVKFPDRVLSLSLINTWAWPLENSEPMFRFQKPLMKSPLMRWMYLNLNFSARVLVKSAWGMHRPLNKEKHQRYMQAFPTRQDRMGTWRFAEALCDASESSWNLDLSILRAKPAQVIWGMADKLLSPRTFDYWKNLFPDAHRVTLGKVGHFVADEAPEKLTPVLKNFYESIRQK